MFYNRLYCAMGPTLTSEMKMGKLPWTRLERGVTARL